MNERLRNAIEALRNLDRSLKPVQLGDAREKALVEGLHGLAAEYGREIEFTMINGANNGDMKFVIKPSRPGQYDGTYGEELAAWLSMVPRRTGITYTDAPVLPQNNWCYINHFAVEHLLTEIVAKQMPGFDSDEPANSLAP